MRSGYLSFQKADVILQQPTSLPKSSRTFATTVEHSICRVVPFLHGESSATSSHAHYVIM